MAVLHRCNCRMKVQIKTRHVALLNNWTWFKLLPCKIYIGLSKRLLKCDKCISNALCFCNAVSGWLTSKISDSISCDILSKIFCRHYFSFHLNDIRLYRVATLQFETKRQKCIRIGISISKISFEEVYHRKF